MQKEQVFESSEFDADVEDSKDFVVDSEEIDISNLSVASFPPTPNVPDLVVPKNPKPASPIFTEESTPPKNSVSRGRKAKLKKIASKYAEQDDEERQQAIEALGSARGPQPKGKKAKAAAEKQKLKEKKPGLGSQK